MKGVRTRKSIEYFRNSGKECLRKLKESIDYLGDSTIYVRSAIECVKTSNSYPVSPIKHMSHSTKANTRALEGIEQVLPVFSGGARSQEAALSATQQHVSKALQESVFV